MSLKIYTRTGDKGQTSLFGGKRVLKSDERVDAYGTVDELNSMIGLTVAHLKASQVVIKKELEKIQSDLLNIGSALANPLPQTHKELEKRAEEFEQIIDLLTEKLPELRNFILPGGSKSGSLLHTTRTLARRTERRIVALSQKEAVDQDILIYFNRLSDLLFTMARFVNCKEKKKETIWKKYSSS